MTATTSAPHAAVPPDREISVFELATPLVYRWRLIAGTALAVAALAAVALFLQRPMFTAKTTFTPETPTTSSSAGGLSALAGVASQLGFNISSSGSVSPDFFVKLAGSGEVLRSTLPTEFDEPGSRERKHPLLNILEIKGRTPEERLQRGGILLRKRIKASADKPTTQPNGNRQGVKRRVLLADDVPKPQSGAVIFVPTRTMQEQPSNVAGLITTVAQGLTARVTIYVVARK